ncbi:MAG: UPF0146 family protein [Halodesulfurarchaeum sp.]
MSGSHPTLVSVLGEFDRLVEVGIGRRTEVAEILAGRGVTVTATDVVERSVPAGVTFRRDDLRRPSVEVYESASAIYALRLPPELQRPAAELAGTIDRPLFFTTLGGDPVVIGADRRPVQAGTLFLHRPGTGHRG